MDRTVSRVQAARSGPVDASVAQCVEAYFERRNWQVLGFQRETWEAIEEGLSGLVHAPTGAGKTQAVWLGACRRWAGCAGVGPRILWITPMRALASDAAQALSEAFAGSAWETRLSVGVRSGDTSSAERTRQQKRWPFALVTTPESLSLLLARADAEPMLAEVRMLVVDEWHELIGSKRGVLLQLALAWLRARDPALQVWGMSASLGNLAEATGLLAGANGRLISTTQAKPIEVDCLLPRATTRFAWAGHLGLQLCEAVAQRLDPVRSALVFTNTRSQAELWFRALLDARPTWEGKLSLHHGSLARDEREAVEDQLRAGTMQCVVCTSSLDLGVDFSPVDLVVQIGSPKGIGRLLQRAGRSGHRPGATSRVLCVPTNAFELVEFSAARQAFVSRRIEPRDVLSKPLDLLVQHLVTMALGGGFTEDEAFHEIRGAWAFRDLTREEFRWALDFVERGGPALRAYPHYARIGLSREGRYVARSEEVGTAHRLAIGTITSDSAVEIRFQRGEKLGSVEEYYIARLKPGDRFLFAGRTLELIRVRNMVAEVRRATGRATSVPQWMGGKMPLSTLLAEEVRARLEQARTGVFPDREMELVRPILETQAAASAIPRPDELLIEIVKTREGSHAFVFPFAGRRVHEGLANLVAMRLSRIEPRTITIMLNDYGFQLLSRKAFRLSAEDWRRLLSPEGLVEDLLACVNTNELARRRFRDVARVAGLVLDGFPGASRTTRQVQASSSLLYDVFSQFDPGNLLLEEARRAVLREQLDLQVLQQSLTALQAMQLRLIELERLSPLAFPLWAESIRSHVSTEAWEARVREMLGELEEPAG